ncbi:hypothetical protein QYF61_027524 [Mycteria americana]|uniref:Uncharacterized protein n=1 Tax=Mycteria americana TaxID=33587 RepID=A0AAN7NM89_MYCAM|nr:hypothetical protein QYF61_027524 [Mycteria americana]
MPPPGTLSWTLKSKSYGDMAPQKEMCQTMGLISETTSQTPGPKSMALTYKLGGFGQGVAIAAWGLAGRQVPPLVQLEAISSCPIACYLGEETDTRLATTSFQHLNVFHVMTGPKLNTVFKVRPHQCRVQGHDHFPSPADHTVSDKIQDAVGLLGHLGTLPAQHPQALFHQAAFQPLFPKPVALHGVVMTQVQDPALALLKLIQLDSAHQSSLSTLLCRAFLPSSSSTLPHNLVSSANLLRIIDKDIKQNWPQHRALGNATCDRPATGVNSIHHHSLGTAIQPLFYQVKSTPIQAMSSQFLQENAMGNGVKGFTKVQDCLPRDSINQSPKQAKVCPPEFQVYQVQVPRCWQQRRQQQQQQCGGGLEGRPL